LRGKEDFDRYSAQSSEGGISPASANLTLYIIILREEMMADGGMI